MRTWRNEYKSYSSALRTAIAPLLQPVAMRDNLMEFGFVLVIGREADSLKTQQQRDRLASYSMDDGITVMTYDSLLRGLDKSGAKDVLAKKGRGFHLRRRLHTEPWNLFAYMGPSDLDLTAAQVGELEKAGYDMKAWKGGQLLVVNGKDTSDKAVSMVRKLLGKNKGRRAR